MSSDDVSMALDFEAESTREEWMVVTSNANAELGGDAAGSGEGNEDVVIKVSDEGGGIRRSNMPRIWSYLFTTADPRILDQMLDTSGDSLRDFDTASPLAGLGYGLPISRNYARYFGGELTIMSMEGYGTDSFIYLPRLGNRDSAVIQ